MRFLNLKFGAFAFLTSVTTHLRTYRVHTACTPRACAVSPYSSSFPLLCGCLERAERIGLVWKAFKCVSGGNKKPDGARTRSTRSFALCKTCVCMCVCVFGQGERRTKSRLQETNMLGNASVPRQLLNFGRRIQDGLVLKGLNHLHLATND